MQNTFVLLWIRRECSAWTWDFQQTSEKVKMIVWSNACDQKSLSQNLLKGKWILIQIILDPLIQVGVWFLGAFWKENELRTFTQGWLLINKVNHGRLISYWPGYIKWFIIIYLGYIMSLGGLKNGSGDLGFIVKSAKIQNFKFKNGGGNYFIWRIRYKVKVHAQNPKNTLPKTKKWRLHKKNLNLTYNWLLVKQLTKVWP